MTNLTEEQYKKFHGYIHDLLEYNTDCPFCDQGGNKNNPNYKSRHLFDIEFAGEFPIAQALFNFGLVNTHQKYILRICKFCGHIERFDFEMFVGKSFGDMVKEIKFWD